MIYWLCLLFYALGGTQSRFDASGNNEIKAVEVMNSGF